MRPVLVLLGALWLGGVTGAETRQPGRIPDIHGTALAGQRVDLPEQLRGRVGVLVVGFSQDARGEVADWGRRLAGDYGGTESVAYYEVAMLGGVPRILRGWVVGKLRDSVPDRARGHFLPVFDHEGEWKSSVNFAKPGDAYVLVVDGAGVVRSRVEGSASDQGLAQVKQEVEALKPR